ncbi:MAG: CDP-alcohol phosphatidyltransferase family protein [Phycisphaerales bacterium]
MFLKLGPRKREFRAAALIPNILTTLALCSGLLALHYTLKENTERAMAAVVIAGVFDALDGRAARLLRVTSTFGAVLDSLSDFLAFGVAPAFIVHQWLGGPGSKMFGGFALAAALCYALCTALRLARFTSGPSKSEKGVEKHFEGMPSPAAAGAVLVPPMLAHSSVVSWTAPPWAVIIWTFTVAALMICRVPMFSLKAVMLGRRAVAPVLVLVGIGVVGMVRDAWLTLVCLSGLYVASIPPTALRAMLSKPASEAKPPGAGAGEA